MPNHLPYLICHFPFVVFHLKTFGFKETEGPK